MAKGHFEDAALDELHIVVDGDREGGACLTGHLASFRDFGNKQSCNYRWQCYEGNKATRRINNRLERYKKVTHSGSYETDQDVKKSSDWLILYCHSIPAPKDGDWDIGGPPKALQRKTFKGWKTTVPKGKNFTSALWPYFNNAHHIIPKGTLKYEITNTTVSDIIQKGLLKAKYNVNHEKNMIFLPMDKRIGSVLHLPRHLEFRAKMSHPTYDLYTKLDYEDEAEEGLSKIIDDYKKAASKAQKDAKPHEIPDVKLSKAKLERLSKNLLDTILKWGSSGQGESLDEKADKDIT